MSVNKQENHERTKVIPLWYNKGLLTLSIGSKVMRNIKEHEAETTQRMEGKFHGLIFGEIKTNDIIIQESTELSNEANADSVIQNLSSYNIPKNYQLMGYYSDGKIPSESDVEFLYSASENLRKSLFLIKYDRSDGSNKVDIFESVPDTLLLVQTTRNPFVDLINDYNYYDDSDNLIRYLFPAGEGVILRYDLDRNEDQKSRLKEEPTPRVSELTIRKKKEFLKNLKEYWTEEKEGDEVTVLSNVCEKAGIEAVYFFDIPIDDKEDRKGCNLLLSYNIKKLFCTSSLTIEGAQQAAASFVISEFLEGMNSEDEDNYF